MGERCGSTATTTGEPCQQPVSGPGETCWRDGHGELDDLTHKQRRFVEEYTVDFNATQAAIRAGYSQKTASQLGYQLLQHPSVSEAVERRMDELAMSADEALQRLADWARGDIGDFIEVTVDGDFRLDLEAARDAGKLFLVRELSYDRNGRPKIKMYDAKDAVKQIAKVHGLFVDRVEHSGEIDTGGDVHVYLPDNGRDSLPEQLRKRQAATNGSG